MYSYNCDNNKKSKHIDEKYRFRNDEIEKGTISVNFTPSFDEIADIFTKPLDYTYRFRNIEHL